MGILTGTIVNYLADLVFKQPIISQELKAKSQYL